MKKVKTEGMNHKLSNKLKDVNAHSILNHVNSYNSVSLSDNPDNIHSLNCKKSEISEESVQLVNVTSWNTDDKSINYTSMYEQLLVQNNIANDTIISLENQILSKEGELREVKRVLTKVKEQLNSCMSESNALRESLNLIVHQPNITSQSIGKLVNHFKCKHSNYQLECMYNEVAEMLIRERHKCKELQARLENTKGDMRIIIRLRPITANTVPTISNSLKFNEEEGIIQLRNSTQSTDQTFRFDKVLGPETPQERVFEEVKPLVQLALSGQNLNFISYGGINSGKTYTIFGPPPILHKTLHTSVNDRNTQIDASQDGLLPRLLTYLFSQIKNIRESSPNSSTSLKSVNELETCKVYITMVELRNDIFIDLLSDYNLVKQDSLVSNDINRRSGSNCASSLNCSKIKLTNINDRPVLHGINQLWVYNANEAILAMHYGLQQKLLLSTTDNQTSRSHTIFTIGLSVNSNPTIHSKLSFVDLASAERISEACHSKIKEIKFINSSLSTLGEVLSKLSRNKASNKSLNHIPYRDNKLTRILQNSLEGTNKTVILACIASNKNSNETSTQDTYNTLVFASNAKQYKQAK